MSRERLTPSEIDTRLQGLDGWALSPAADAITRRYRFDSFVAAFGFMTECALYAEKIDHHPEWSNVYRNVEIRLTTHSSNGLTVLDFDLAALMDKAAGRH